MQRLQTQILPLYNTQEVTLIQDSSVDVEQEHVQPAVRLFTPCRDRHRTGHNQTDIYLATDRHTDRQKQMHSYKNQFFSL